MTLDDAMATLAVEFEGARLDGGLLRYRREDDHGAWDDAMDAEDVRDLIEALAVVLGEMEAS